MKRIQILAASLVLCIIFIGCTEQTTTNKTTAPLYTSVTPTNPYDTIGVRHNEAVDNYKSFYQTTVSNRFFYYDRTSYITQAAYDNILNSTKDYMINGLKYDPIYAQNCINSVNTLYSGLGLFVTINGNKYVKILKDYYGAITYSYQHGLIDSSTYSFACTIYTPTNTLGFYTNVEQTVTTLENTPALYINNPKIGGYLSTYRHSQIFWAYPIVSFDSTNQSTLEACGLNPNQALIVADAAGTLIGGWFLGAVASCCEAEDQANHNSILVGACYPESRYYPN